MTEIFHRIQSFKYFLLILFTFSVLNYSLGQCPTQSEIETGGTYTIAGNCNITTSGNIEINGTVVLTGGGTFTFSDASTQLHILNGASLTIESGTTLDMDINNNDNVKVFTGGELTVSGSLLMDGVDGSSGGTDFEVEGGTVTVTGTGYFNSGDDLKIYNGGIVNIDPGGIVDIDDVLVNDIDPDIPASNTTGTLVLLGVLNVGEVDWYDDTSPPSQIMGNGIMTISEALPGAYYVENPLNSDCGGCLGVTPCVCSGVLHNFPTVITSTADTLAKEDTVYTYNITTVDVDGEIPLITAPIKPSWLTLTDNGDGTAVLTGTPDDPQIGVHNVTIRANDGSVDTDQSFTITVTAVNDPPTSADKWLTTDAGDYVIIVKSLIQLQHKQFSLLLE